MQTHVFCTLSRILYSIRLLTTSHLYHIIESELHPPRSPRVLDVPATVCWIVGVWCDERGKNEAGYLLRWFSGVGVSLPLLFYGNTLLAFLGIGAFFCSTGELFSFFPSTAVAFVCSGWHVWLFMVGGEGSSPASKHVTALYFVFHSEGRVLWQIFWRLINFLFALWMGEGERERQTDKRSKKKKGCFLHTTLPYYSFCVV